MNRFGNHIFLFTNEIYHVKETDFLADYITFALPKRKRRCNTDKRVEFCRSPNNLHRNETWITKFPHSDTIADSLSLFSFITRAPQISPVFGCDEYFNSPIERVFHKFGYLFQREKNAPPYSSVVKKTKNTLNWIGTTTIKVISK